MERREVFQARANEASELIGSLLGAGLTLTQIAAQVRVSERTVARWGREGRAPHPVMLDSLRKLAQKRGKQDAHP